MPKLTINGHEIEVPAGYTVLQACQMLDTEIPVFCYHNRLAIAGNCRMCLVEIENSPKPVASCAMPVADGMVIHTRSEKVQKARKGVLEFLLINHPLDCPICDQGGECDLQDITMAYGPSTSRYEAQKRAVSEKYMGPLVKTFMTRCIHCTRCVRFATEVAGVPELGAVGRGEHMEIVSYLDQAVHSEMSGNLVDVCPVGALTSKPYQFKGRPWELEKIDSIDVHDAVGSNIRLFTYGMKVVRVLPRLNEEINEEWISDRTRHACDGLALQRLDTPYLREKGALRPCSWEEAFTAIQKKVSKTKPEQIGVLCGDLVDCESIKVMKDICDGLGVVNRDCCTDGAYAEAAHRNSYLFNTSIAGIEHADFCLIIGANVRADAPLVMTRLRKRYLQGNFQVAYLGGALPADRSMTLPFENLGADLHVLDQILQGKHPLASALKKAQHPMVILGQSALKRQDAAALLALCGEIAEKYKIVRKDWNGFNVLQRHASRVGALDLGFVPGAKGLSTSQMLQKARKGELEILYLLGEDSQDLSGLQKTFIVYQGHHGDHGAAHADVILPGAAYTEKNATYVNTEGRVQQTWLALDPPGQAKADWEILRQVATVLGVKLAYGNLEGVRQAMAKQNKVFATLETLTAAPWKALGKPGKLSAQKFGPESFDFYQSNVICRHSKTMALCVQELCHVQASKEVVNG